MDEEARQQLEAALKALHEQWRDALVAVPGLPNELRAQLGRAGGGIIGEAFQAGMRHAQAAPIQQAHIEIVVAAAHLRGVLSTDLGSKQGAYEYQVTKNLIAALDKLDASSPEAADQLREATAGFLSRWRDEAANLEEHDPGRGAPPS